MGHDLEEIVRVDCVGSKLGSTGPNIDDILRLSSIDAQ